MKREILFRGKTYDGHWIYGNLLVKGSFCYIIGTDDSKAVEVIPESVGQYTGLKDCKGNKIFEGDIMTNTNAERRDKLIGIIEWNNTLTQFQCSWTHNKTAGDIYFLIREGYEVIGNIHDNPELIKNN